MKSILKFILFVLIISSCTPKKDDQNKQAEKFTSELLELKEYFQIPGLAISIEKNGKNIYKNYLGFSDLDNTTRLDSTVLFPIASITKVFSGVLIMKLAEQKKISLEEPINKYLPKPILGDSILIKHVLSHTSQGKIGENFYYSSRFGLLTHVIEQASGKPFKDILNEEILIPLKLKNTFLLKDSTQIADASRKIAKPYILNNGIKPGFIDFGYSSSAGIVSNLEDLTLFSQALDHNTLISEKSRDLMFSPFRSGSPYGLGIFNKQFQDLKIVWSYGQYDCYSSLLLKIPSENITFILLANNNLLSDPARLIYGDPTTSLFALSFLKNYILDLSEMELLEKQGFSFNKEVSNKEFYRKKILAQALAESYMARFEPKKLHVSAELLNKVFTQYPDYLKYADLTLLHNLSFLKDIAFHMELGEFNNFDNQIINISKKLLQEDPENPYLHLYMGTFYDRKGNKEKAKQHFESIVKVKNFSKNWYTQEAQNWLDANE